MTCTIFVEKQARFWANSGLAFRCAFDGPLFRAPPRLLFRSL